MLFSFMLWAGGYYSYGDGESYDRETTTRYSDSVDYDDDENKSSYTSSNYKPSSTNYANGRVPDKLKRRLEDLFSIPKMRHLLNIPDVVKLLRKWDISILSSNEIYARKGDAIHDAVEDLCGLLKEEDPYFCSNERPQIERIVIGTFHNMKSVVLNQFLQFVQKTLKEEKNQLASLQKKIESIKQQEPGRRSELLKRKAHIREEIGKLDKEINQLKIKLKSKYDDDNQKTDDEETLSELQEQKKLLIDEREQAHRALGKHGHLLVEMEENKHKLQADIEKFKIISIELPDIVKEREDSSDLKNAWEQINKYFEKFEKDKQTDKQLAEEKARKLAEKSAKEEQEENKQQAEELKMIEVLGSKSSDPEAAKESANWLSSISKLASVGGG